MSPGAEARGPARTWGWLGLETLPGESGRRPVPEQPAGKAGLDRLEVWGDVFSEAASDRKYGGRAGKRPYYVPGDGPLRVGLAEEADTQERQPEPKCRAGTLKTLVYNIL